jgi:hypothetical protein
MKKKSHEFGSANFNLINLPPSKIDDYEFKVHINGKTHQLVLKDDYDKLNTRYAFVIGILSTMPMFAGKTISKIIKWVEDYAE